MIRKAFGGLLLLLLSVFLSLSWADVAPPAVSMAVPTLEELEARRKAVESAGSLTDDQRRRLLETYDQTLGYHRQLQQTNAEADALRNLLHVAADRTVRLREQAQQPAEPYMLAPEAESSLDMLTTLIAARETWLAEARDNVRSAEGELARLIGGSAALGERIANRAIAIEQIQRELAALPTDSLDLANQARSDNLRVRLASNQAALALRQEELANLGELTALHQAIRDASNRNTAVLQAELEQFRAKAQQLREVVAREAVEQADRLQDAAALLPPEVLALAGQNRELRAELASLVAEEQNVATALQRARQERDDYRADFERIRNRVEVVGRSEAIAKVLHARRAALPSLQTYRSERMGLEGAIRTAIERQLNVDDMLIEAPALRARLQNVLASAVAPDAAAHEQLGLEAERLLDAYIQSLNELQQGYARHLNSLTNLDVAVRERFDVAQQYVEFIEEQLLWMPNTSLASLLTVDYLDWTRWALDLGTWRPLASEWLGFASRDWLAIFLALLLLHALRRFNRSALNRLAYIDRSLNRVKTDSSRRTLEAVLLVALRVLPWPLALFLVGWTMHGFVDPLAVAIGEGLINASLLLGYLWFVAQLIRPNGIGPRHLRWSPRACAALARPLRGFTIFLSAAVFVISLLGATEAPAAAQAIGSVVLAAVMGAIFILLRRLFGEQGEMRACIREDFTGTWAHQLHFLWYPLALATPLVLGLASLGGYYYTAMHFTGRILMTVSFIFVVYVVTGVILRWLYVTERRLRYDDAIRRRDQLRAQRANESGIEERSGEDAGDVIVVEAPEINYESLSEQSRRLVHTGFIFAVLFGTWGIWANLIPALGFLEATNLPFETTRLVDGVSTVMPITLADLVIGLFIVIVTFLAARNLPGILELSLLQRLPLDPGARYAITALSQYLIAGVGLIIAVQTIGFQWSGLQWLIAALGVGLGFGLQEIVANFVSGIILLFERPIRVGDVVTIDGTTGVVTRIQIRATTITNYDKQELIVPNKEFITGRLINWTLSDKLNRILIPVGLAYGEDADKALELMREAAVEIPEVLEDPAPAVSFESFGDDALMLYLRAYLANMDNRLATITALHRAIYNKFNAAGLSIAFPQRDVHLDIKHPLDIRLRRAGPREAPAGESA